MNTQDHWFMNILCEKKKINYFFNNFFFFTRVVLKPFKMTGGHPLIGL